MMNAEERAAYVLCSVLTRFRVPLHDDGRTGGEFRSGDTERTSSPTSGGALSGMMRR